MHVIDISADGTIHTMHTDHLPLHEIGTMTVRRASTVEFNESTQLWEVRWPDSPTVAFSNASRSVCIEWEVREFNQQLLAA